MNTIISCVAGMIGGGSAGFYIGWFLSAKRHGFTTPIYSDDEAKFYNPLYYGAIYGAVIGLLIVLGSGQRL